MIIYILNLIKKHISLSILLFFLSNKIFSQPVTTKQDRQPNIIFIMVDDLGYRELGAYGNTFNETPNLDQLAKESKMFKYAYSAAAVCSPTRASIMTGQYPARVGITDFLDTQEKTKRYLQPEKYTTLNEALQQQGYHTVIIGKWHLDTQFDNPKGSPKDHGFNEVIGSETEYIADGDYFYPYTMVKSLNLKKDNEYLTDRQNEEACDFLARQKDKPFFLYLSYYSVHTRLEAPDSTVNKYKQKYDAKYGYKKSELFENNRLKEGSGLDNPYLAAMLEHIDQGIGKILKTLKEKNLSDNTLVIFTSDNGGANHVANNGELKAYKTWLYEGGIRVPLLFHWPKKIAPGIDTVSKISSIDFYPTFVAAANSRKKHAVDGQNLIPLLTKETPLQRETLYWHYPCESAYWTERMSSAIIQGDFKLIHFYLDNRYELYNLKNDPSENNNLAHQSPNKLNELKTDLDEWRKTVNAEKPNSEALEKARKNPLIQAANRIKELEKNLELTSTQKKDVQHVLESFFLKNEEIRMFFMKSDERKIAREQNNKNRNQKLKQILTPSQWEKYKNNS